VTFSDHTTIQGYEYLELEIELIKTPETLEDGGAKLQLML